MAGKALVSALARSARLLAMTPQEGTGIIRVLEDTRQELNAAAGGISEAQATVRPEPGRWSVLECVEHVTAAEERFLSRLEQAERWDPPRLDKQREAELAALAANRKITARAPEPVRPAGRFATLAQALKCFNAVRTRTVRFAEERAAELHSLAVEHPRFGTTNGTELLLIAASHTRRHAEQIREVTAAIAKS
jgi:uncharacterized damage-inducible protein DinB